MKRRKLWMTGEDGLCCSSSAIQIQLGPSSSLEEWSEIPIVFVSSCVLSATPQTGGNGQGIEIDRTSLESNLFNLFLRKVTAPTPKLSLLVSLRLFQSSQKLCLIPVPNISNLTIFFLITSMASVMHDLQVNFPLLLMPGHPGMSTENLSLLYTKL